jgi:hypothetical protein
MMATMNNSTATVPPPLPAQTPPRSKSPKSTFYLPSPTTTTTTTNPLSRVASRHLAISVPTSPHSRHGQGHRRSKSSLSALKSALQTYKIPSDGSDVVSDLDLEGSGQVDHGRRDLGLMSPFERPIGHEMMDALVDIHRVLYRGREDRVQGEGDGQEGSSWEEQGKEVQRVVERWFEGDCRESPSVSSLDHRKDFAIEEKAVLTWDVSI